MRRILTACCAVSGPYGVSADNLVDGKARKSIIIDNRTVIANASYAGSLNTASGRRLFLVGHLAMRNSPPFDSDCLADRFAGQAGELLRVIWMAFLTSLSRKREQSGSAVSQLNCRRIFATLAGPIPLTVRACRVGLGQSRKLRLYCVHGPGGHSHSIFGGGGGNGVPIWDHRS